jgi:hypothetical protein
MTKTETPLLAKIRKLMAKANDSATTEAEAAAFAAKVQELLLQNGLAMSDVKDAPEQTESVSEGTYDFKRWNSPHRRGLMATVCTYYMCSVLYMSRHKKVIVIGKPQNVEVALSMTDYLIGTVVRLSTQYGKTHPGANIVDFRRGAMLRLRERLIEEARRMKEAAATPSRNPGNLPAVFQSESQLVSAYVRSKYNPRPTKARAIKHGADAWAGRKAADGISLHQQVGAAPKTRRLA